ncbi:hypothetical protein [Flavobacterium olei]|uniref:hypothetical protein n=1 Tax=Flavobacterium olei TaxID=1886782 RepID=UPI00321A3E92
MKKIIILVVLAFTANLSAQSSMSDDLALIQQIYGKSKQEVIKEYIPLTEPKATAFQKIYDAYEVERKALGATKLKILDEYAANYDVLSDAKASELTEANLKNIIDFDKLLSKTHSKLKKEIGGTSAAKFVQLEQYLQVIIRAEMQDAIPFIDELKHTSKK